MHPETLALYLPGELKGVQYRLMNPIDFDLSKTYPLILSLHGGIGRGTQKIKNPSFGLSTWQAKTYAVSILPSRLRRSPTVAGSTTPRRS